jgi:hypothetical protein
MQTFIDDYNYKQSVRLEDHCRQGLSLSKHHTSLERYSHRRTCSDGHYWYERTMACTWRHSLSRRLLSNKTASLPCRIRPQTSLLDDSLLVDDVPHESFDCQRDSQSHIVDIELSTMYCWYFPSDNNETRRTRNDKQTLANMTIDIVDKQLFHSMTYFQGPIERQCLLKNYRKCRFNNWKVYWLIIYEHVLVFYKAKSVLTTLKIDVERTSYRSKPTKYQSIVDWLIIICQKKSRHQIQLNDLNHGLFYLRIRYERVHPLCFV